MEVVNGKEILTTAECAHIYGCCKLVGWDFDQEAITAAYVAGLAALQEKAERENPAPLTPEQIRQMRGKPVYCPEIGTYGIITMDNVGFWENTPFLLGYWLESNDAKCGVEFHYNIEDRGLTLYPLFPYKPLEKGGGTHAKD